MSRARTPFGAVPISTIYGFEYPLSDALEKHASSKHELADPYYSSPACSSLSFMPMALRASRGTTPVSSGSPYRESSMYSDYHYSAPPVRTAIAAPQKSTTMSFSSTTPWNATGFYYSPRYPQSHKGTASTYSSFSRRYPVRRFVPSYGAF